VSEPTPIDAVEVALDVDVEHPDVTPASLTRRPDGVDGRSAWSIAVGILVEDWLKDGFQISLDDFLGDAIGDCWNTKRPLSRPSGLRDHHPPYRRRKVAPRGHSVSQLIEVIR
jgi:hypothetical protein